MESTFAKFAQLAKATQLTQTQRKHLVFTLIQDEHIAQQRLEFTKFSHTFENLTINGVMLPTGLPGLMKNGSTTFSSKTDSSLARSPTMSNSTSKACKAGSTSTPLPASFVECTLWVTCAKTLTIPCNLFAMA
jgi:hypothetical protein